jgi:hypothetical protein
MWGKKKKWRKGTFKTLLLCLFIYRIARYFLQHTEKQMEKDIKKGMNKKNRKKHEMKKFIRSVVKKLL